MTQSIPRRGSKIRLSSARSFATIGCLLACQSVEAQAPARRVIWLTDGAAPTVAHAVTANGVVAAGSSGGAGAWWSRCETPPAAHVDPAVTEYYDVEGTAIGAVPFSRGLVGTGVVCPGIGAGAQAFPDFAIVQGTPWLTDRTLGLAGFPVGTSVKQISPGGSADSLGYYGWSTSPNSCPPVFPGSGARAALVADPEELPNLMLDPWQAGFNSVCADISRSYAVIVGYTFRAGPGEPPFGDNCWIYPNTERCRCYWSTGNADCNGTPETPASLGGCDPRPAYQAFAWVPPFNALGQVRPARLFVLRGPSVQGSDGSVSHLAVGVSDDGRVTVGGAQMESTCALTAVRWVANAPLSPGQTDPPFEYGVYGAEMLDLAAYSTPGRATYATAANADGSTIVGAIRTGTNSAAAIWLASEASSGLQDLNVWLAARGVEIDGTLEVAYDVSDDGQTIAGVGRRTTGELTAFIVELDCDGNQVNDVCEIDPMSSEPGDRDCNGNLRPDRCDLANNDCNANGIPDECDIASGFSQDCNRNGVPDECSDSDCNENGTPDECEYVCDVVFVVDTSGSMALAIEALAAGLDDVVADLEALNINLRITAYQLGPGTVSETFFSAFGAALGSGNAADISVIAANETPTCGTNGQFEEAWGWGVRIVAQRHPWRPRTARVIVPLTDEGPHCGGPISQGCNDPPLIGDPLQDSSPEAADIVAAINACQVPAGTFGWCVFPARVYAIVPTYSGTLHVCADGWARVLASATTGLTSGVVINPSPNDPNLEAIISDFLIDRLRLSFPIDCDFNRTLDECEMTPPACAHCWGDFQRNGGVDVGDLFGFLAVYFEQQTQTAPCLEADTNRSGTVDVADLFAFLAQYFAPCS